ncbi:MAG: crossover junction endodeoxyribonuclease RuvC, partial [Chloroflexi bacterium]
MPWKSTTTSSPFTRTSMFPPTSWSASASVSSDGLIVLGVDPGLADTGYGAVRRQTGRLSLITSGTLKTPANLSEPQRLKILAQQLRALLAELRPEAAAFEQLFFSKNVRTAMAVGQARGVALVCAVEAGAEV